MVRAWYMDDCTEDQRLPHIKRSGEFLTTEQLYKLTGIEYFKIDDVDDLSKSKLLNELKAKRGYSYEDEITCSEECLPNYEEKLKSFFEEHLHTDEEIRLVLDGSGYFDARDSSDSWIRVEVVKGDMIILPKGIYHRFTLDCNNFVRAKRFFIGEPVWTPYNRPADDMGARQEYLTKLARGF